jgi:hypothetical protein
MSKYLFAVLVLVCFLCCPLTSRAEDPATTSTEAFQLSLFHPVQLHSHSTNVDGFRFDLVYGVNHDVQGLDVGLVNKVQHDFKGVEVGLIYNTIEGSGDGFQAALFYNDAQEDWHGVQLGIVNHAGSLKGIQIGLVNYNDDQQYKGFMPFINAAF